LNSATAFITEVKRMDRRTIFRILILGCLVLACGCSSKPEEAKRYRLEGTVVSIDKPQHQARIQHKEIPGFMGAMTMSYTIRDDAALDSLRVGDSMTATVVVTDTKVWLEDVHLIKHGAPPAAGKG
jgi:Cu/Ag efflux protein CusF